MSASETPVDKVPFFFFERTGCDLPYYRGTPVAIGMAGWLIILLSVVLAVAALMMAQRMFHSGVAGFIPPLLFVTIPLAGVALAAGPKAPLALFRSITARDIGIILLFFIVNAVVTISVGYLITGLFHTAANPASDLVASAHGADRVLFFGWTAVQLLGEEIFTILPFLAFLALLNQYVSRKVAICVAVLGASVIFAMIHLPTYRWNVAQAMVGLVPVRIVLLMPFLITRNIWASTGTHILNDWAIFGLGALMSPDT